MKLVRFLQPLFFSNPRARRGWRRTNHGFRRWAPMIPVSWDWQKKAKILQACLQSFCFTLPHSRSECTRAHLFVSAFIRAISGFILFFPVIWCDLLVRRISNIHPRFATVSLFIFCVFSRLFAANFLLVPRLWTLDRFGIATKMLKISKSYLCLMTSRGHSLAGNDQQTNLPPCQSGSLRDQSIIQFLNERFANFSFH